MQKINFACNYFETHSVVLSTKCPYGLCTSQCCRL